MQYGFEIPEDGIVFCGDEPLREENYQKVEGVDICFMKLFVWIRSVRIFKPHEKQHSIVKDVCIIAQELKVKNLVLMHTEDSHIKERKELYTRDGKDFF